MTLEEVERQIKAELDNRLREYDCTEEEIIQYWQDASRLVELRKIAAERLEYLTK